MTRIVDGRRELVFGVALRQCCRRASSSRPSTQPAGTAAVRFERHRRLRGNSLLETTAQLPPFRYGHPRTARRPPHLAHAVADISRAAGSARRCRTATSPPRLPSTAAPRSFTISGIDRPNCSAEKPTITLSCSSVLPNCSSISQPEPLVPSNADGARRCRKRGSGAGAADRPCR
jgi:hypothetical protein